MGKILGPVAILTLILMVGFLMAMVLLRIELVNYPAPTFPALQEARGQTVALVFFRSCFCGPSVSKGGELDRLNQHLNWFERFGIKLIAATVPAEGEEDFIEGVAQSLELKYPVAALEKTKAQNQDEQGNQGYGVYNTVVNEAIPANFIIDKSGKVRFEHRGAHGNDWTPHWLLIILAKLVELLVLFIP